ncbi:MAG: NAD-dependent epimerase/dehydratase family protein, partial [Kangiellaceae bacterium]
LVGCNSKLKFRAVRPKKVLVLGGTGFFGPVLVEELIKAGHEVTLFNRGISNPHLFPQLRRLKGDREIENTNGLNALKSSKLEWDWVVDTWQNSPKCVQDTSELLKGRVGLYQYVSTFSVYDKWDRIGIKENEPLNPVPEMPTSVIKTHRYAIRKTLSELALNQIMGNSVAMFRSHGMRGERKAEGSKHEPYWQVRVARGGDMIIPAEADYYQITDVVSLAKFMVHCGEQQITGPFNVACKPTKFDQFLLNISKTVGSDIRLHRIPLEFLTKHGINIWYTNRVAGRYRFNVDQALNNGLKIRPHQELTLDQLKGYKARHPKDDFVFGKPGGIQAEKEKMLLKLWQKMQKSNV